MAIQDLLTQLKQTRRIPPAIGEDVEVVFQILQDERGVYLETLDVSGRPLHAELDYTRFSGAKRQLIRQIQTVRDAHRGTDWDFGWGLEAQEQPRVYLHQHPILFAYLREVGHLWDAAHHPVWFAEEPTALIAELRHTTDQLLAVTLALHTSETTQPITMLAESWALAGQQIFEVKPIGENFGLLAPFQTTIQPEEVAAFLSLFYSSFENIEVRFSDYTTVWADDVRAQLGFFFDRVDTFDSLFLRIDHALHGMNPALWSGFRLSVLATLQPMERKIRLQNVVYDHPKLLLTHVEKLLKSLQRDLKGQDEHAFFREDHTFIIERNLAQTFLQKHLATLITQHPVFGADKLKTYKIRAVQPKLNLNLNSGIDFLEGDARLMIEGESFPLFEALQQVQRKGYVQLNDGTQALINEQYVKRLERIFRKKKDKVRISFFDTPLVVELLEDRLLQDVMPRAQAVYEGFNTIQERTIEMPDFLGTLRPYQAYGLAWMDYLHQNGLGGCLADDMGLGKTAQTIAMLSSVYPKQTLPSLIVMPTSLLFNWEAEIIKFNPKLRVYTYYGNARNIRDAAKAQVILTTYGMLRSDISDFRKTPFHYVVLDESQHVKNMNTQASQAVMLLNSQHRLALSGTPIENNLGELYALFRFLNPSMFGSAEEFSQRYAQPIQKMQDEAAAQELRKKIYPFILRRLKKDVAKELPDRVDQTMIVEMNPEQKQYYESRRRFYLDAVRSQVAAQGIERTQFFILQAMTELRQIASIPEAQTDGRIRSPKRDLLMEQVSDAVANGHKILIFTNFLAALEAIGEDLTAAQIPYVSMSGVTTNRRELVQSFQENPKIPVFLMTLKTGGYGLNLTQADQVFLFDPWWNVAAEQQAIDRTHRIGQDRTVFSYRLIAQGSIEEKIQQLQAQKRALFDAVIGTDGASLKSLSSEDIEYILG